MRILFVSVYPYPRVGGVSTYLRELSTLLRQHGHEVEIIALDPESSAYYSPVSGSRSPLFWDGAEAPPDFPSLDYSIALSEVLARWKRPFDVIHAMDPFAVIAARQAGGAPLVMTLHGRLMNETATGLNGWRRKAVERTALLAAHRTIVASAWLKGEAAALLPPEERERLALVANGLDVKAFDARLEEVEPARRPSRRWVIVCAGRLVRPKGQYDLIMAIPRLRRRRVPAELWLVGGGPAMRYMRALARRQGLRRAVRFAGERGDVIPWLKAADVVVVPSHHDNQPYAVIEGQLAGKPVVAAAVGGIREMIVDRETGRLVKAAAPRDLADALEALYRDSDFSAHLAARGRAFGEQAWSGERWVRETLGVYAAISS